MQNDVALTIKFENKKRLVLGKYVTKNVKEFQNYTPTFDPRLSVW
jgi:hypothetical protein